MKLVQVEWLDSGYSITPGWVDPNDVPGTMSPKTIKSVGFVVHEDKKCLIICQSKGEHYVQGVLRIMKSGIKKIKNLTR